MRVLITGICGYLGSRLALQFLEYSPGIEILGIDSLSRRGSETNLELLKESGVQVFHGDLRLSSDVRALPETDWVVDCAANPAVLAGIARASGCTPEQLTQHNLLGTLHVLEYCRERCSGLILLSTSRVYSIEALSSLPLSEADTRYEVLTPVKSDLPGFSERGIAEEFSTAAPISLYGATKLASEILAMEYSSAFGFPLRINRCGVVGGPGQFGKIDQGIFSFWVYSCALGRPLRYIGFGGSGKQVRDCISAEDTAGLVWNQMNDPCRQVQPIVNVGGGREGSMSLLELTNLCELFFGRKIHVAASKETRPYDIPYYVTDTQAVENSWGWRPSRTAEQIVTDLCEWTTNNIDLIRSLFS